MVDFQTSPKPFGFYFDQTKALILSTQDLQIPHSEFCSGPRLPEIHIFFIFWSPGYSHYSPTAAGIKIASD